MKLSNFVHNSFFSLAKYRQMYTFIFTVSIFLFLASFSIAATFTVTKTVDTDDGICDSDCSLREAITTANSSNSDDVIEFGQPLFSTIQTITLSGTQLGVQNNGTLSINGTGSNLLTIDGNNQSRIFYIEDRARVTIQNLSVTRGNNIGQQPNGEGGGVFSYGGFLTINNCLIHNNRSVYTSSSRGGGIESIGGTLDINSTTITNNYANVQV